MPDVGRTLALDVGRVRVGVAVSCPLGIVGLPLEVIDRRRGDALARVAAIVAGYAVHTVVVGRPCTLAGHDGPAVRATESFARALAARLGFDVQWWDERLSTVAAERAMIEGHVRRAERRQRIDMVAASLILQSYLDAKPYLAARAAAASACPSG